MLELTFKGFAVDEASIDHSRITQLVLHELPLGPQLFSVTRYDGVLQQWDLGSGTIEVGQNIAFSGALQLGGAGALGFVETETGLALLTGGMDQDRLQLVTLDGDGAMIGQTALTSLPASFAGLQYTTTVALQDGTQVIYGAFANSTGIAQLQFSQAGVLQDQAILQDPTALTAAQITGTAQVMSGGQFYLLTISTAQNGVSSRLIGEDGTLSEIKSIGVDDGLWINAPTDMATVTLGGVGYAVVAAAGTDSLSVVEVGQDGGMIVRDHILDTLITRFGGVVAVEIIKQNDKAYVVAGGADDGISVFVLLEGGLLVHRAQIADTVDYALDNVSAIAGFAGQDGLEIFVASSSEAGVTQLNYDTGAAGITATAGLGGGLLLGTGGFDILQGHDGDDIIRADAGNDILRDGGGSDRLTGGAGRDLFVMTADGQPDTITDFTLGEDQIDLSLWPMLRDSSQLSMTMRSDGMQIIYGDETLIVQTADGGPIDYRDVASTDLIGGSRVPVNLTPGYPGPATPVDLFGGAEPAANQGGPYDPMTPVRELEESNQSILRDALDLPTSPADGSVVNGQGNAEVIFGTENFDLLFAGAGHDVVQAGDGNDTLFGRAGDDMLFGEDGSDTLYGGAGDDWLEGGFGDDLLRGGSGADTFVFNGGQDVITDYQSGEDTIRLDPSLWTGLTSAADLLFVYGETTQTGIAITFDTGDRLLIEDIYDTAALADDLMLF